MNQVMESRERARASLARMEKGNSNAREKAAFLAFESILNNYSKECQETKASSNPELGGMEDYDFILLANNEISLMSSKLMVELGLATSHGVLDYQIIPGAFRSILELKLQNCEQGFVLPLVIDGALIVKQAYVRLIPSVASDLTHLLVLKGLDV